MAGRAVAAAAPAADVAGSSATAAAAAADMTRVVEDPSNPLFPKLELGKSLAALPLASLEPLLVRKRKFVEQSLTRVQSLRAKRPRPPIQSYKDFKFQKLEDQKPAPPTIPITFGVPMELTRKGVSFKPKPDAKDAHRELLQLHGLLLKQTDDDEEEEEGEDEEEQAPDYVDEEEEEGTDYTMMHDDADDDDFNADGDDGGGGGDD